MTSATWNEATPRKTVNGPLKWHGGKHYLAPKIVALMPPHTHYVEAFAGGLAVLLAKNPEGVSEVVNDLDGDLTNFWRVIADETTFNQFQRHVHAVPFSEAHWHEAQDTEGHDSAVDRAVTFFIRCRQSLAGRMDAFAPITRSRTRCGMNEQASAWLTAVEGLPAVHERLKRVVILGPKDAKEVIIQQDGDQTLFYLDPSMSVEELEQEFDRLLPIMDKANNEERLEYVRDLLVSKRPDHQFRGWR